MLDKYTFVVVGGGIAGVSCTESLPFWSESASVLLVSASPCLKAVTNAVQLSKTLTKFDVEEQSIEELKGRCAGVDVIIAEVLEIDTTGKQVILNTGQAIGYEKICIATGGQPKLIECSNKNIFGIRDTDSVIRLRDKLSTSRRIMVVGNGGIATELMYEVTGVAKVWVIKDKHISSTFVDAGAAMFLHDALVNPSQDDGDAIVKRMRYAADANSKAALGPDWHSQFDLQGLGSNKTVNIEYGTTVSHVETTAGAEYPLRVTLENGTVYYVDMIVSATGVIPCGHAIKVVPTPLELDTDGGIRVDEFLQTNIVDVYAAGDVVSAAWPLARHWHQMRLWTQARQMGQYAAKVMAAELIGEIPMQDFCFELFSHVTKFFGFKVVLLGLFNGQKLDGEYDLLIRMTKGKEFIKLVMKEGKIQGAILIGETDLEEMCENLILDQLDVSHLGEDLLNPDVDIDDYFD